MYYMVFGSKRRPVWGGESYLDWDGIVGVYSAENPEDACKAAARDNESFGTYFAVPGYPWGVEMEKPNATTLGKRVSAAEEANDRILSLLERMEENSRPQLDKGEDE